MLFCLWCIRHLNCSRTRVLCPHCSCIGVQTHDSLHKNCKHFLKCSGHIQGIRTQIVKSNLSMRERQFKANFYYMMDLLTMDIQFCCLITKIVIMPLFLQKKIIIQNKHVKSGFFGWYTKVVFVYIKRLNVF